MDEHIRTPEENLEEAVAEQPEAVAEEQIATIEEQEAAKPAPAPQKPKKPADPFSVKLACAIMFLFGGFNVLVSLVGIVSMLVGGAFFIRDFSVMAVLVFVGALQILAGVMGIKSIQDPALRQKCRHYGLIALLACVTHVITTVFLRGFQWSTVWSVVACVVYLGVVRE